MPDLACKCLVVTQVRCRSSPVRSDLPHVQYVHIYVQFVHMLTHTKARRLAKARQERPSAFNAFSIDIQWARGGWDVHWRSAKASAETLLIPAHAHAHMDSENSVSDSIEWRATDKWG